MRNPLHDWLNLEESINRSLLNLLSYPWIEDRVTTGKLSIHGGYYNFIDCTFEKWVAKGVSIHGGYYNFIDCTFEKWTLDYKGKSSVAEGEYSIKITENFGPEISLIKQVVFQICS